MIKSLKINMDETIAFHWRRGDIVEGCEKHPESFCGDVHEFIQHANTTIGMLGVKYK